MAVKKDIRRSLRKPSGQRVELGWSGEHGDPVGISGICKDVSEGGMCVVVRDAPPMRAYVQFRLVSLGFRGVAAGL
jgi:hypothetical protein